MYEKEFNYKGYKTIARYSLEDKVYYGKLEDISDLVTFESDSEDYVEDNFIDAVNYYSKFLEKERTEYQLEEKYDNERKERLLKDRIKG